MRTQEESLDFSVEENVPTQDEKQAFRANATQRLWQRATIDTLKQQLSRFEQEKGWLTDRRRFLGWHRRKRIDLEAQTIDGLLVNEWRKRQILFQQTYCQTTSRWQRFWLDPGGKRQQEAEVLYAYYLCQRHVLEGQLPNTENPSAITAKLKPPSQTLRKYYPKEFSSVLNAQPFKSLRLDAERFARQQMDKIWNSFKGSFDGLKEYQKQFRNRVVTMKQATQQSKNSIISIREAQRMYIGALLKKKFMDIEKQYLDAIKRQPQQIYFIENEFTLRLKTFREMWQKKISTSIANDELKQAGLTILDKVYEETMKDVYKISRENQYIEERRNNIELLMGFCEKEIREIQRASPTTEEELNKLYSDSKFRIHHLSLTALLQYAKEQPDLILLVKKAHHLTLQQLEVQQQRQQQKLRQGNKRRWWQRSVKSTPPKATVNGSSFEVQNPYCCHSNY